MNNTNRNGTTVIFDLHSSNADVIGYSLAYGLLGCTAFIGNVMVLFVVYINKSMRTTINALLVNLSVSDILFIILCLPGYLTTEIYNQRWLLGLPMAVISQGFTILSAGVSVFTLMAIAFERYFAIIHPLKHRTRNKSKINFWALVIIWICSTAFALPFAVGTGTTVSTLYVRQNGEIVRRNITFLSVDMNVNTFRIYYMVIFIGLHVVPFVSLIIMYVPIAWKLWHPDRQLTDQPDTASNDISRMTERNRRRTTIMVIAVLLAFFVCFFPFHIYFLIQLFSENFESKPSTESSVLRVILMLNAAINPIIYNLLSENFRAAFRAICACFLRAKPEVSSTSPDTMQSIAS